ncbi:hypothetical protein [Lysobacter sp. ESA13C]|uniref:hypothetical protein n=1 Tax=Lysobacter sp. ESA13C TaxID=2862676 RepID=UPI001CC1B04E|nr:hypothetical protein [Lysobacter sp. ESA13C]
MTPETLTLLGGSLKALERHAVEAALQHPDAAEFWPAFACYADPIIELAGNDGDAHEYVCARIDELLIALGKMDPAERQT